MPGQPNKPRQPRKAGPPGPRDLSAKSGNATSELQAAYHELMAIPELETLKKEAIRVVQGLVGKGISLPNFKKFQMTVLNSQTLQKLQFYITNYILAGSDLAVAENAFESAGSLLTEDVSEYLTLEQEKLANMVGEYGLYVKKISESAELPPGAKVMAQSDNAIVYYANGAYTVLTLIYGNVSNKHTYADMHTAKLMYKQISGIYSESESAAWQRKDGKNKEGGLNEKGRKSYEKEHPGSDLKSPSKEVGNKRRDSFCSRMKGMKDKLTSSKTASDPNSRINKSLRAWNCNEDHIAIAMGKQLDDEGSMILNQLDMIEDSVKKLRSVIKSPDMQLPAWVQAKVTLAVDYMQSTAYYMASKNEKT